MAMLANGPACTSTGCPSMVCIRLGLIAARHERGHGAITSRSAVVTGLPFLA